MPVFIMGECHPLVVDGPARLTDSPEKLRARIDQLSVLDKKDLRDMTAEDSAHSECTDSFCKELEKSDLEKAGMKQLKKKKKRKADKWGDNDRPVLDTTLELSPVLMPNTEMSPFASPAAHKTPILRNIDLSCFSESQLGMDEERTLEEETDLLDQLCPDIELNDSYDSQGDYDDLALPHAMDETRDVVVETEPVTLEDDLPVTDTATTAQLGQRGVGDEMEVISVDTAGPAAAVRKTRKRKRHATVIVAGIEHVVVPTEQWRNMSQLVGEMKTLIQRVNVLETESLRNQKGETPVKKVRMAEQTLSERLRSSPHLVDPKLFCNWWSKGAAKCLPRKRCLGELLNMGFPPVSIEPLSTNYLCEVYCLCMKLLLAHGAIDKLPVKVPVCYAHPKLTAELCKEKLAAVSGPVSDFLKESEGFFQVDLRRAGAVAAALEEKPKPEISVEDARNSIQRKTEQGQGGSGSRATWKSVKPTDRYKSRTIWSTNKPTVSGNSGVVPRKRASPSRGVTARSGNDLLDRSGPPVRHTSGVAGHGADIPRKELVYSSRSSKLDDRSREKSRGPSSRRRSSPDAEFEQPQDSGKSDTARRADYPQNQEQSGGGGRQSRSRYRETQSHQDQDPRRHRHRSGSQASSRRRERSRRPDSSSRDRRDRSREAEEKIPGFSSEATRSAIQSPTTLRGRNFSPGSASRDRDLSPWSKADANTRRQGGFLPKRR